MNEHNPPTPQEERGRQTVVAPHILYSRGTLEQVAATLATLVSAETFLKEALGTPSEGVPYDDALGGVLRKDFPEMLTRITPQKRGGIRQRVTLAVPHPEDPRSTVDLCMYVTVLCGGSGEPVSCMVSHLRPWYPVAESYGRSSPTRARGELIPGTRWDLEDQCMVEIPLSDPKNHGPLFHFLADVLVAGGSTPEKLSREELFRWIRLSMRKQVFASEGLPRYVFTDRENTFAVVASDRFIWRPQMSSCPNWWLVTPFGFEPIKATTTTVRNALLSGGRESFHKLLTSTALSPRGHRVPMSRMQWGDPVLHAAMAQVILRRTTCLDRDF